MFSEDGGGGVDEPLEIVISFRGSLAVAVSKSSVPDIPAVESSLIF